MKADLQLVKKKQGGVLLIGEKEVGRCIINARVRQQFQVKPGRQEWITVVECICADGSAVPPLVIFKGENLSTQWIPASIHGNWRFNCNSKGWTSNGHELDWLKRCFDPETRGDTYHMTYVDL